MLREPPERRTPPVAHRLWQASFGRLISNVDGEEGVAYSVRCSIRRCFEGFAVMTEYVARSVFFRGAVVRTRSGAEPKRTGDRGETVVRRKLEGVEGSVGTLDAARSPRGVSGGEPRSPTSSVMLPLCVDRTTLPGLGKETCATAERATAGSTVGRVARGRTSGNGPDTLSRIG